MLNPTFEKAYEIDEGLRWREVINRYFVRQRIIEKKDMEEFSKTDNYPRPLWKCPALPKKKFSFWRIIQIFIP